MTPWHKYCFELFILRHAVIADMQIAVEAILLYGKFTLDWRRKPGRELLSEGDNSTRRDLSVWSGKLYLADIFFSPFPMNYASTPDPYPFS